MEILPKTKSKPVVMSLSGHDPSGGAGIQADIEAIHAQGCHAVTIITCLTVQDTQNVYDIKPVPADLILQKATAILKDMSVHAFKIGLIGSLQNVEAVEQILKHHPDIPVILDPVLAAGGGNKLSTEDIVNAIREKLLPLTAIVTPNIPEAQRLSGSENIDTCAEFFHHQGCKYSLITGTHSNTETVVNTLYHGANKVSELSWDRLDNDYHGSGCTLASTIAAFVASEMPIHEAVQKAQKYTWDSLNRATLQGYGQLIPNR